MNYKVGESVIVIKKSGKSWMTEMNQYLYKVGKIIELHENAEYVRLDFDDYCDYKFWFDIDSLSYYDYLKLILGERIINVPISEEEFIKLHNKELIPVLKL